MRSYVAFLICLLCSSVIGQVDSTAYIQGRLDNERVIDLQGKTYYVSQLIVGTVHNQKELKNGVILALPDKTNTRHAIVNIVKGRGWMGRVYPATEPLNFTFRNLEIGGHFRNETADITTNILRGQSQGWWCNAVSVLAPEPSTPCWVDSITIEDCKFFGVGASGVAMRAKLFNMARCSFNHIGMHAFSTASDSGPDEPVECNIERITVRDCGTAFDFSSAVKNSKPQQPKVVNLNSLVAKNIYGRTKIHGPWTCNFGNLTFEQEYFIPSQFGAINIAEGNAITMKNVSIKNFWLIGVHTLQPLSPIQPKVKIDGMRIENSLSGLYVQIYDFEARNVEMVNCWNTYTNLNPTYAENVTNTPRDTVYWAKQANRAEFEIAAWNAIYGTAYSQWSRWWIPEAVKTEAMKQRN